MRLILSLVLTIFLAEPAIASDAPVVLRKSLLKTGKINLVGLISKGYSDLRYDYDGDGSIDYWQIQIRNTRILSSFSKNKLQNILIVRDFPKFELKAKYHLSSKENQLILSSAVFEAKKTEYNSCHQDFSDDTDAIQKLMAIKSSIEKEDFHADNMLDKSCLSEKISPEVQNQIKDSFYSVYNLNIKGTSVDNQFIHCLASNEVGQPFVLGYISKLGSNIDSTGCSKVTCTTSERNEKSDECVTGKMDRVPCEQTSIQIFLPICQHGIKSSLLRNIFHEALHPEANEKTILKIVNLCMQGVDDGTPLAVHTTVAHDSESGTRESAQKVAANAAPVSVPPEIAAGGRTGLPALNAGFSGHGMDQPVSASVALTNSHEATSGMLNMANRVLASAVVPTAFAASPAADITKASATFTSTAGTTSTRPSSQVRSISSVSPTTARVQTKSNLAALDSQAGSELSFDSSSSTKSTAATGMTGLGGKSSKELASSSATGGRSPASREISGGGDSTTGADPVSTSSKSTPGNGRTPISDPSSNKKNSRELASASDTAITNKIKNLAPEEIQARRNQLTQTLTQKNPQEAWNYIRANSAELSALGIHVLDSKNRAWGHKDPKSAEVKILEINHKLISEDR